MSARELLRRATGMNLSQAAAERAVRERMAISGLHDSAQYLRAMSADELSALVELVVVPESWLFRDPDAFAAATAFVQRRLAEQPQRRIRILSLPCAGGEEPYSIAMALRDAGVAPGAVAIDAIDLSRVALARAVAGRYTRNAFRNRDLAFRARYFTVKDGEYQIRADLRAQVSFSQGNLFALDTAANAGRYDVLFCRNLLIYFDEPETVAACALLHKLLADDGPLFAGHAEVPAFCRHGFAPLRMPGAFALQKQAAAATPQRRTAPRTAYNSHIPHSPYNPYAPPPPDRRAAPRAPSPGAAPAALPSDPLSQAQRQADRGEYKAAAASCHALLAVDPGSADAYFILGMVSECQHQVGAAADYWRRCVYLRPDHYEALCHLALLAERSGDARQAGAFQQRAARVWQRRQAERGEQA